MDQVKKRKKAKKARVIPGFHLTLGIVVTMLSLIVLIPLALVLVHSLGISPKEFFALLWKPNVRNAFFTSIGCSFAAAVCNAVFGLVIAEFNYNIHNGTLSPATANTTFDSLKTYAFSMLQTTEYLIRKQLTTDKPHSNP